jgi:hypothetical protein
VNGNRSYNPRSTALPGVTPAKRPLLKLVVSNDQSKEKTA